jgi:hypothetical protein
VKNGMASTFEDEGDSWKIAMRKEIPFVKKRLLKTIEPTKKVDNEYLAPINFRDFARDTDILIAPFHYQESQYHFGVGRPFQ